MGIYSTNHYTVLGFPCGIEATKLSQKEITKAFRIRALQLHPDKHPNDPNAIINFQLLNSSYQFLCDPQSRKLFDQHLLTGFKQVKIPQKTTYPPYPKETVSFHVSWKVGEGLCDYSAEQLNKIFSPHGTVEDVLMLVKYLHGTRRNALISIFLPSAMVSLLQLIAIGDPSNYLQVELARTED